MCRLGTTSDGKPVLLTLDGANAESTDACLGFLRELVARGLRSPLLVITDGARSCSARSSRSCPTACGSAAWCTEAGKRINMVISSPVRLVTVHEVQKRLWVPKTRSSHAAWAYSWISPPSRSSRTTRSLAAGSGSGTAPTGGA